MATLYQKHRTHLCLSTMSGFIDNSKLTKDSGFVDSNLPSNSDSLDNQVDIEISIAWSES